jgi:SAM-dependent methyltransferase
MDRHVWDRYADWGAVATSRTLADLKTQITGVGQQWQPNVMSDALSKVIRAIMAARTREPEDPVTVIDFGCGLGRNLPLLRSVFHRVIALDIPEMTGRLRDEQAAAAGFRYDAIYDDIDALLRAERVHFVYDSVVFQHIVDPIYVSSIVDRLVAARSFVAIVSLSIATSPPSVLAFLAGDHGWSCVFSEVDTTSFNGAAHQVRVFSRPREWRLAPRGDVLGIEPDDGDWRPVLINGAPAHGSAGWQAVALRAELAPTLLLMFERPGERAVWFIDETGHYLANRVGDLPTARRAAVRGDLRRILGPALQRKFDRAGRGACVDLLDLVAPSTDL